jgi:beta-mannanase
MAGGFLAVAVVSAGVIRLRYEKTIINTMPQTAYSAANTKLKWGVYAGGEVNEAIEVQRTVGRKPDYLPTFVHWGNNSDFPSKMAEYAYLQRQTLVIYWEAMDYNAENPETDGRFSYGEILTGKFDGYLETFAGVAAKYGRPIILIPFEEMNGNWYPWAVTLNGNTPQKHIDAYRYVRRFFDKATNVKFGWAINNDSIPDTQDSEPLTYYPGDKYVDYVGVNGFNFGDPWQSWTEVFDDSLKKLATLNKPIIIFSMASGTDTKKEKWITTAGEEISSYDKLEGWIWFNQKKEQDWRIWSDPRSLRAFKRSMLGLEN